MQSNKGCVRLRDALKYIGMHLRGHYYSRVELLTTEGAEKSTVASAADCEVEADSLTAGHERKHNACRAESEVVLVVIPISAESKALRMCLEALLKSAIRHRQVLVHRTRHKANRLVTGALKLLCLAV